MTVSPKLIAFDLDDTLAPSKTEVSEDTLRLLLRLLEKKQVAVISGADYPQFKTQLLDPLEKLARNEVSAVDTPDVLSNLSVLPTCGTKFFEFQNGKWVSVYEKNLDIKDRATIRHALEEEAQKLGLWETLAWGEIIEDRGSQVTFSALGQRAPIEAKQVWDPSGAKKDLLRKAVQERLPDFEVRSGGSTSVDVTPPGIDKAFGIQKLIEMKQVSLENVFFIGDRLDPQGNDYPVKALGVKTYEVESPADTNALISELLESF